MWFLLILWKTFRGMWRLVIGLIIGVVLYVITFTNPSLVWIFNGVHGFSNELITLLSEQSWFGQYEKWNNLVKPGDRLPLILFVLVGRFVWLLFEAILFTFPLWLFNGRNKQKKTANSPELAPIAPENSSVTSAAPSVREGMAPVMGHSSGDKAGLQSVAAPAAVIAASAMAGQQKANQETASQEEVNKDLVNGHDRHVAEGEDLEQSIDEALARIKQVGEQNSNT